MTLPRPPRPGGASGNAGSAKFTEQFNRLVGNRTGRPVQARPKTTKAIQQSRQRTIRKGAKKRGTSISLGTSKLPKAVEKSRVRQFGELGSPGSGIGFEQNLKSSLEGIYDDLTSKLIRYENEAQQVQEEYVASTTGVNSADPMEKWNAEHPDQPMEMASPIAETWAGTPLGVVSQAIARPGYAVHEGLRNMLEEGYKRRDEGGNENDWGHIFGDILSGAYEGLSGKKQTGAGEIYEVFKNKSATPVGTGLRSLEESHPWVEEQISRGVGFLGELTLDPIDKFGLGRASVINGVKGVANEATMRQATSAMARDVSTEFADNIIATRYPNRPFIPARDAFITHGEVNALDSLEKSELSIHGGGRRGTYQVQNGRAWAQTVSNRVAQSLRNLTFQNFNNHTESFYKMIDNGRPSTAAVQTYIAMDDDFARMIDDLDAELVAGNRLAPHSSLDDLLDVVGKQDKRRINNISANIVSEIDADLAKVKNDAYEMTRNATYNTMGIRVGKKVIPVRATGRAYKAVAQRLKGAADESSNMSYEKMFPSILSLKAQKARSVGVKAFDKRQEEMIAMARKFTEDEGKLLHTARENGTDLSHDPHLQEGLDFLDDMYNEFEQVEHASGARPDPDGNTPGSVHLDNYVYVYTKGGSLKKRTAYKKGRKEAIHKSRTSKTGTNRGRFSTQHAKDLGLKPVEDAFEALAYRSLKHQRDMTRALYATDLVENYGFWSNKLNEVALDQRQVSRIDPDKLPNHLRQELKDKGGDYYLPAAHVEMLDKINEMLSWNSASMQQWMRDWNKVIGILKTAMTIPAPGFHINNMIGDAFMGLMDGVKPSTYAEILRKANQARSGATPMYKITDKVEYSHQELWNMYQADAAGGYYRVDQGGFVKPSVTGMPKKAARAIGEKALDIAETREDFGRFAHYIHALREEATLRAKKGMTGDLALQQARDAALWRVNYYKFDYNALTLWERKLKTLGVPFYTYTRKVIPVLLASMFENPKYINMVNRFFQYNDGSSADGFSNWNVPGYLRMGGAAFLSDEAEPWTMAMGATPLAKLNMLQGGEAGTMNPANPEFYRGMARTGLEQLNPIAQTVMEMGFGKELFKDDIIEAGGELDYFLNKLPVVGDLRQEGNTIPGLREIIPGEDKKWDPTSLINSRQFGAGLQVRPLTRGQQSQAQKEWVDQLIQDPMYKVNNSQDLFEIKPSNQPVPGGGISYQVLSKQNLDEQGMPSIVREFSTVREATEWVKKNMPKDYEKPDEFLELGPTGTARYTDPRAYKTYP